MQTLTLANKLTDLALENGGATLTLDGEEVTDGYLIGGGIIKDGDALYTFRLEGLERNAIAGKLFLALSLSRKQLKEFQAVGIWFNDGVAYLDAVTIERNFIKAVTKGLSRKQQAIGGLEKETYTEYSLNN